MWQKLWQLAVSRYTQSSVYLAVVGCCPWRLPSSTHQLVNHSPSLAAGYSCTAHISPAGLWGRPFHGCCSKTSASTTCAMPLGWQLQEGRLHLITAGRSTGYRRVIGAVNHHAYCLRRSCDFSRYCHLLTNCSPLLSEATTMEWYRFWSFDNTYGTICCGLARGTNHQNLWPCWSPSPRWTFSEPQ